MDAYDKNSDIFNLLEGLKFLYNSVNDIKQYNSSIKILYPPENSFNTDNDLIKYAKEGNTLTYHFCSTCSLGKVVNPLDFSIYNYNNIHVADASVFPSIPDGNTEFPTNLIAEIASERIINSIQSQLIKSCIIK